MEPYLKKLVFFLLLSLLLLFTSNAETKDMEVYIDIPTYLELMLFPSKLDFGELDEAVVTKSIDVYIRSNIKSWKITAKATYASLTLVPPSDPLIKIPYKVSFADFSPSQVLIQSTELTANTEKDLYTFNRITSSGEGPDDLNKNKEKFTFTVEVDPMGASDVLTAGTYEDTITFTVIKQ